MEKKAIGIIGGMGPLATVELFRMIVENTKSETDQDHIRIFIDNNPSIPDRTASIIGKGPSPVSAIVSSAQKLEEAGADFLIIPCNTSHYYFHEIQEKCHVPVLNMIEETAKVLNRMHVHKAGLLATTGTISGKVYNRILESYDVQLLCPEGSDQAAVMDFIYSGVKARKMDYDATPFADVIQKLFGNGIDTMILGCTEIPVGMQLFHLSFPHVDAMETLAKASVLYAGYTLK